MADQYVVDASVLCQLFITQEHLLSLHRPGSGLGQAAHFRRQAPMPGGSRYGFGGYNHCRVFALAYAKAPLRISAYSRDN